MLGTVSSIQVCQSFSFPAAAGKGVVVERMKHTVREALVVDDNESLRVIHFKLHSIKMLIGREQFYFSLY